jgi:hypothetical protein
MSIKELKELILIVIHVGAECPLGSVVPYGGKPACRATSLIRPDLSGVPLTINSSFVMVRVINIRFDNS